MKILDSLVVELEWAGWVLKRRPFLFPLCLHFRLSIEEGKREAEDKGGIIRVVGERVSSMEEKKMLLVKTENLVMELERFSAMKLLTVLKQNSRRRL